MCSLRRNNVIVGSCRFPSSLHKSRLRSSLVRTIDAARLAIMLRVPTLSKTCSAIRSSSRRASLVSMGNVDHSLSSSTAAPKTWKESALHALAFLGQLSVRRIGCYH
jgi:hypothetical protein